MVTEKFTPSGASFWDYWPEHAPSPETIENHLYDTTNIGVVHVVHTCWFSLLADLFARWQLRSQQRHDGEPALAENALFRRKLIDAWMDLQVARAIHEDTSPNDDGQIKDMELVRHWLLRCLKIFAFELACYLNIADELWQVEARKFIQENIFSHNSQTL